MSCKFSYGSCGGCNDFVKTTAITVDGQTLILEIPDQPLNNGEHLCVCLAQCVPETLGAYNVAIKVNGTPYTVINTFTQGLYGVANNLYTTQLRQNCDGRVKSRQIIPVKFATDTLCFNYVGGRRPLCPSGAFLPVVAINGRKTDKIVK